MITQLNPPLPVITPKGKALAHFLIDDGTEHDLKWVCFQDGTGECWTYPNPMVRAQKNITQGRDYISPFYDPEDVALPKDHFVAPATGEYKIHEETSLQKQIKEAKRMYETPLPNFEQLAKPDPSIVDHQFQEKIAQVAEEIRGNEIKILDDFCKAYYAAESLITGKEFIEIAGEVTLNIQTFYQDGQMVTRYWLDAKEYVDENNEFDLKQLSRKWKKDYLNARNKAHSFMIKNKDLESNLEACKCLLERIVDETKNCYDLKQTILALSKSKDDNQINYLLDLFPFIDKYDFDDEDE